MDFYERLSVQRDADVDDIKRAFKRLARRLHPDINPGDRAAAVRFQAVVEAYETLTDPERRRRYDACGASETAIVESVSFGFEGFDFSGTAQGPDASTFGDLFADVIHETLGGRSSLAPGSDLHAAVSVSFAEMMRGTERPVTVPRRDACPACRGAGLVNMAEAACGSCGGTGAIRSARGHMVFTKTCTRCGGSGRQRRMVCPPCGGTGVDTRSETIPVWIPPGVRDGERLRVGGKGHAGPGGGPPGDLYVEVQVEPHPLFRREGDDVLLTVPVAIHEAALGTRIDIPTVDGPARLRVLPGTQAGQRIRLRDRGVPTARMGHRGDLVVDIRIVLPSVLDERSKALLREFGQLQAEDVRAALWSDEPSEAAPHSRSGSRD
jgi:molecular chaperone DnaJ